MLDICSLDNIRNFRQAQNLLQQERELNKSKIVSQIIFDLQLKGLIQEEANFKVQGFSPRINELPSAREKTRYAVQSRQQPPPKKPAKKEEIKQEVEEKRKPVVPMKAPPTKPIFNNEQTQATLKHHTQVGNTMDCFNMQIKAINSFLKLTIGQKRILLPHYLDKKEPLKKEQPLTPLQSYTRILAAAKQLGFPFDFLHKT